MSSRKLRNLRVLTKFTNSSEFVDKVNTPVDPPPTIVITETPHFGDVYLDCYARPVLKRSKPVTKQ